MARNLRAGNGISRPQAKSNGLCNVGDQVQADGSSYVFGDLADYGSGTVQMSENNDFLSASFPSTSNQRSPNMVDWPPGDNDGFWPSIDVPSLPPEFLASVSSDTYDTRDYDPTEQSLLLTSSDTLNEDYSAQNYEPNDWDSSVEANPIVPPGLGVSQRTATLSHSGMRTEIPSLTVTHKRKRPVDISVSMKNDPNFIEKKNALKLFAEMMPNPSLNDIRKLAKGFDVQCGFVLDLCLQETAKRELSSAHPRTTTSYGEFASMFTETAAFGVPAPKNLAVIKGLNAAADSVGPSGLPQLSIEPSDVTARESGGHRSQCPKCGAVMSRPADLPRHLKTHLPRQLRCPYPECRKRFNRKDKLDDHYRRVHRDLVSKADVIRGQEEDPESDPDYGSGGESGFLQPHKRLQGSHGDMSSASSKRTAGCGSSSHGVKNSAEYREIFYPVSQNVSASESIRKFDSAQVIRKLGQGGFGHVYELAVSNGTGGSREAFACKIISLPNRGSDDAIKRARNEISILQALDHPHIINFVGAFISGKEIVINTRPVANCNLREFLSSQSPPLSKVAKSQLWEAVNGLASALYYLHSQGGGGGFHGDIKPENILVIQDAEIKSWTRFLLADFGSARLPTSVPDVSHRSQAVTPRYCAPECFADRDEIGSTSDIWSFGCIFIQIVTYLHDRTMTEFEAFRTRDPESKMDWTYQESLPAVKGWLHFLYDNSNEFTGFTTSTGHLDLITDMLSLIPRERPSAIEVFTRLEMFKDLFTAKMNQMQSDDMELMRPQTHQPEPNKFYDNVKRISKRQENEGICKWRDEWHGKSLIPRHSTLGKSIPTQHAADSVKQPSQELLEIDFVGTTNLASSTSSSFIIYTPEIDVIGKTINCSLGSITNYDLTTRQQEKDTTLFDSSICNMNYQPTLAHQQQQTLHFRLHLVPKYQQSYEQPLGGPSSLLDITLKDYSSPYTSGRRSSRRLGRRHPLVCRSSTEGTRNKIACPICKMKGLRPLSFMCNQYGEHIPHPSKTMLNYKCSLGDYKACFFPKLATAHLDEAAIREFLHQNTIGFTDNRMTVFVSVGPNYAPMKIIVYEFVPSNRESLRLRTVTGASATKFHCPTASYALPLGIANVGNLKLINICLGYMEFVVEDKRSLRELHGDETSVISSKVWEAVNSYRQLTSRNGGDTLLLRKACMLYAMHHFMGRAMCFTKMSAEKAASRLQAPVMVQLNAGSTLICRVLDRQLKKEMNDLLNEMTSQVLDGLENRLSKRRNQSSWAESFGVLLIICTCIEETQAHLDALAFFRFFPHLTHHYGTTPTLGSELFLRATDSFRRVYQTSKPFNPLQDGLLVNEVNGITQDMVDLVRNIRQLMNQHGNEIEEKAGDTRREFGPDHLTHHLAFRKWNSGRLVSKFLKSFT